MQRLTKWRYTGFSKDQIRFTSSSRHYKYGKQQKETEPVSFNTYVCYQEGRFHVQNAKVKVNYIQN